MRPYAPPLMSVMRSRRLIASPKAQDKASCRLKIAHWKRPGAVLCVTANFDRECPLWVKSGHSSASALCPLYPQKRTSGLSREMSALCQKQTFCAAVKNVAIRSPRRRVAGAAMALAGRSAFAVLKLITSSNFVGRSMESSSGLAPGENSINVTCSPSKHRRKVRAIRPGPLFTRSGHPLV